MIKIITDDGADISKELIEKFDIEVLPISVIQDEKEYFIGENIDSDYLYEKMREGESFGTSQVTRQKLFSVFEKYAKEGIPCIYIPLSKGISSTYESAIFVKDEVQKEYPEAKIYVLETTSASTGQGMLVLKSAQVARKEEDFEKVVEKIIKIDQTQEHLFTVGELKYLYRGGRLSKTSQVIGGLLNIIPIMSVDKDNGKLFLYETVRGDKGFFRKLKTKLDKKSKDGKFNKDQTIFISHGQWEDMALKAKDFLVNEVGVKEENIVFSRVGCVIGTHTGPEILIIAFSSDPEVEPYLYL